MFIVKSYTCSACSSILRWLIKVCGPLFWIDQFYTEWCLDIQYIYIYSIYMHIYIQYCLIRHLSHPVPCLIQHWFSYLWTIFYVFFTLCNPTPCPFRHIMSLPVHVRLNRFHCTGLHCIQISLTMFAALSQSSSTLTVSLSGIWRMRVD